MNAGIRKFRAAAAVLGIGLLCGCAAPRSDTRAGTVPVNEPIVRLPYGTPTPLTIEQSKPPTAAERTASPPEVEEGRAHSLKLFEVEFGQNRTGPPVPEEPAGPSEAEP